MKIYTSIKQFRRINARYVFTDYFKSDPCFSMIELLISRISCNGECKNVLSRMLDYKNDPEVFWFVCLIVYHAKKKGFENDVMKAFKTFKLGSFLRWKITPILKQIEAHYIKRGIKV